MKLPLLSCWLGLFSGSWGRSLIELFCLLPVSTGFVMETVLVVNDFENFSIRFGCLKTGMLFIEVCFREKVITVRPICNAIFFLSILYDLRRKIKVPNFELLSIITKLPLIYLIKAWSLETEMSFSRRSHSWPRPYQQKSSAYRFLIITVPIWLNAFGQLDSTAQASWSCRNSLWTYHKILSPARCKECLAFGSGSIQHLCRLCHTGLVEEACRLRSWVFSNKNR